jgi:hypothetical protein
MVETTIDIRFSADDEASAAVETSVAGDTARQAELLCFAHYAARTITELPRERALQVARALGSLAERDQLAAGFSATNASVRVLARCVDTRRGPRMFFRVKVRGDAPDRLLPRSLPALLRTMSERQDSVQGAALIGSLALTGRLTRENEFGAALAAADVAWGVRGDVSEPGRNVRCPSCGSTRPFEAVIWPSDDAGIRKCAVCAAGIWLRRRRRPRLLPRETWDELQSLRAALTDRSAASLLDTLRSAFVENRWPFAEVRGAPALVSELSGPQGSWKFYAHAVDEQDLILLYSICPLRVPPDRRREVADYITRTNYGLAAGNFELDFEDGELRYKTALHVHGDGLDSGVLKRVVRANGLAVETYLAGVEAVIAGAPVENQARVQ